LPQKAQFAAKKCIDAFDAVHVHTAGGQLDGQGKAVELTADAGHSRCVGILQRKAVRGSADPIRKELRCRKCQGLRGGQRVAHRRTVQRRQTIHMLAFDP
jgi:hypothetical protein